jgi:hypothetical protein
MSESSERQSDVFIEDQIIGETKHMYTAEIVILVVAGILGSAFMILAAISIVNNQASEKAYQEYIDSIKIGDTFGHNLFKLTNGGNPFSEIYDSSGFDRRYCITIIDIKKNTEGHIWVKYCFTWRLNAMDRDEWTDPIEHILSYYTRISKRIDNINTSEE